MNCIPAKIVRPPGQLMPLVNAIGEHGLLRLLEQRGGTVIYVPRGMNPESGLGCELQLDAEACRRLVLALPNEDKFKVPLCRQWRAQVYRCNGLSYTAIALKLGVTESAVHSYLRDAGMTAQLTFAL